MVKGGVRERTGIGDGDSLTSMEKPICAEILGSKKRYCCVHHTDGSLQPDVIDSRAESCWLCVPC